MQAYGQDDIPFLCLAGVREYHEHPAHSGDHWELHRPSGTGRLIRLIEIISKYGLETIDGLSVQIIPKIDFKFKIYSRMNTFDSICEFIIPPDICDADGSTIT